MLAFCGQERTSIDANGRLKLSQRFLNDFSERGTSSVVLHCLPEGAIAVYPEDIYIEMRKNETHPAERAAGSMVFRRTLRYFGSMSHPEKITLQGRITLPEMFRKFAGIECGKEVILVGAEIGIEIWNPEKWEQEIEMIKKHSQEKGNIEMDADLKVIKEQP